MSADHISDDDLERYYLGMVTQSKELTPLEEHRWGAFQRAEETRAMWTRSW